MHRNTQIPSAIGRKSRAKSSVVVKYIWMKMYSRISTSLRKCPQSSDWRVFGCLGSPAATSGLLASFPPQRNAAHPGTSAPVVSWPTEVRACRDTCRAVQFVFSSCAPWREGLWKRLPGPGWRSRRAAAQRRWKCRADKLMRSLSARSLTDIFAHCCI